VISLFRYWLRPIQGISPISAREVFEGALLRTAGGYGCIHPWIELGDLSLEGELEQLRSGRPGPLARRALDCCRIDGEARRIGRSLWEGLTIPESHFTYAGGRVPEAFRAVKVKGGVNVEKLMSTLRRLPGHLRIRIDCNNMLRDAGEFRSLWRSLEPWHQRIDFVEDPLPFDHDLWRALADETGCRFAVDRAPGAVPDYWVRVIKPALQEDWTGSGDLVFTSYLDHPVGQLFAAWCAAREASLRPERIQLCGLVTHHLFAGDDPFFASLGPPQPVLTPPSGTGLGWNELLESLPWEPLN
jgi:O-succinylbenzoate synthase